jgi:hypothetical protein
MDAYSTIFRHCTHQERKKARGWAYTLGAALFTRLAAYLEKRMQVIAEEVKKLPEDQLLVFYNLQWNRFTACSKISHCLWRYLQRHWLLQEWKDGNVDVMNIFDLHIKAWKEAMLDAVQSDISNVIVDLIRKQRDGEIIEQLPSKSLVTSICTYTLYTVPALLTRCKSFAGNQQLIPKQQRQNKQHLELMKSNMDRTLARIQIN